MCFLSNSLIIFYYKLTVFNFPFIKFGIIFQFPENGAERAENLCDQHNHYITAFFKRAEVGFSRG